MDNLHVTLVAYLGNKKRITGMNVMEIAIFQLLKSARNITFVIVLRTENVPMFG